MKRISILLLIGAALLAAPKTHVGPTPEEQSVLEHISANSLRGHLSFIASDLLEGRDTPSPGLNIAAEYIAAQFRRAGLEPVVNGGYFQEADFVVITPNLEGFDLQIGAVHVPKEQINIQSTQPVKIATEAVYKLRGGELDAKAIEGKVVLAGASDYRRRRAIERLKPAAIILFSKSEQPEAGANSLVDADQLKTPRPAFIVVRDPAALKVYENLPAGVGKVNFSIDAPAPFEKPVKLRNVAGVLRGSDPALKDTYVLVTAHYDHVGVKTSGDGDRIYNGANDDGSGTVSVIEIANAIATMKPKPRRSILFMTFFGEEKGLLGSQYYGRHPLFPVDKTIAEVNLEQIGRTDDVNGPQVGTATFTGFDYSDLPKTFEIAGSATGVKVYKSDDSDSYFARSDNQSLADRGVPAHTLAVSLVFPDYHKVTDEWDRIDYANMAKIDHMVALGLIMLANNAETPKWNEANPKTARYVKAWRESRTATVQ
ncbi:MAG: M28 family peptidase [Acidobacteriota bacterium]|nr:M28 family peptidase [Acidobacteriota bacterium]